jgi:hypothetical protein
VPDGSATISAVTHRTLAELEAGLDHIRRSPADGGTLDLIVRRPAVDEREVLTEGRLDVDEGLVGDTWRVRGSRHTPDGSADVDKQLNVINARAIALMAGSPERRSLAGDQLHLDLDLSHANLPPGTRLAIGDAVIEVTAAPHTGCAKFRKRFGEDALKLTRTEAGVELRLRGIAARVVTSGTIRAGDSVQKLL